LHLSQACLHNPQDGKNYIQAEVNGTTYSIACLEKGKKEHDSFDLFFDPTTCAFKNQGKSEVHMTGYFEPDEGDDEGSEEEAPKAAAAPAKSPKSSPKVEAKSSPKVEAKSSPKVEAKNSPKVAAKESPKVVAKTSPKAAAKAAPVEDDDDEEDSDMDLQELMEEGEESELEESEEEDAAPEPVKKGANTKRKAESAPAAAPPAKKAAASPKAAPGGGEQAGYVKALADFLKKNGKTSISQLGSKVQRPKDCPKMKVIFSQNPDKFNVQGDSVSAK